MLTPLAIVPLKAFRTAKQRLDLPDDRREELARAVAGSVVEACQGAGFEPLVVASSPDVEDWAVGIGASAAADPGTGGLDAAAARGVAEAAERGVPWLVVHADLPLLDAADLGVVKGAMTGPGFVIAPSRDGGTNLLGGIEPVAFHYGPGSFHRHLHAIGHPVAVIVRPGTAVEIDTLTDLHAAARLPSGMWLARFLS